MALTVCNYNVNNLFARYRFGTTFPGDRSGRSRIENANWGYLPLYDDDLIELFNETQREMAAAAISDNGTDYPDIVCLQEVESLLALRKFNEQYLDRRYKYALLVDSRDFRQIDVGILSRVPIVDVRSHVDDLDPKPNNPKKNPYLFSRDCLEVTFALPGPGGDTFTLLVNHLKSKYSETAAERKTADACRRRQAEGVAKIIRKRWPGQDFGGALFAVLGDLNDDPASHPLQPLMNAGLVPLLDRIPTVEDRWTHWWRSENTVSQLDHVLLSPALAQRTQGGDVWIERRAVGFSRVLQDGKPGPKLTRFVRTENDPNPIEVPFRFPRFAGVSPEDYGSDHCPVFFEIP